ncbi:hypothetical protein Slin15195_G099630 [Septoria linicola]|uniref:Glycosyltransferase family 31 protein n=1 Tax=Septoria linicola TaxID=215465 RepID=A0A9Q9AWC1_9PEZI|nr:hypothetical protein Slin14017_G062670 [Septoria linicola]USW56644.1 hypothetical protein Slin15195_G099630 [Septoria linicola]
MSAGSRFTLGRIAIIFLFVVGVFLFRDTWLPTAREYTTEYKGRTSAQSSSNDYNHDPAEAQRHHEVPLLEIDTRPPPAPAAASDADCKQLPGADKVMVMLKTGATELYQKLPTHFVTTFKCVPNFIIFSDLNQSFADVHIYDAIAPVSKKIRDEHEDFKLYREIEKWQREGQDMSKLRGGHGWNLDKWKFLPMFHQVFESASDEIEWFVMIEADTSLSWLNLLLWLQTMDPKKPYYLGAQNVIGDTTFGHGGSGVVVSRKAADILEAARYNAGKETYDQLWEEETAKSCCGDEIIARAFKAVDIPLTHAWPVIQGETIATVDFTGYHWCAPPLTWHHVTPIEVDAYWQFQLDWAEKNGWKTPYLYRDIFDRFLAQHVSVNRTSWNNLSSDKKFVAASLADPEDEDFYSLKDYQQAAVESEEACAEACMREGDGNCIQWMWTPGRCHLGRDMRFGNSDEREEQHWNCGWIGHRIDQFRKSMEGCKIRWDTSNI